MPPPSQTAHWPAQWSVSPAQQMQDSEKTMVPPANAKLPPQSSPQSNEQDLTDEDTRAFYNGRQSPSVQRHHATDYESASLQAGERVENMTSHHMHQSGVPASIVQKRPKGGRERADAIRAQ